MRHSQAGAGIQKKIHGSAKDFLQGIFGAVPFSTPGVAPHRSLPPEASLSALKVLPCVADFSASADIFSHIQGKALLASAKEQVDAAQHSTQRQYARERLFAYFVIAALVTSLFAQEQRAHCARPDGDDIYLSEMNYGYFFSYYDTYFDMKEYFYYNVRCDTPGIQVRKDHCNSWEKEINSVMDDSQIMDMYVLPCFLALEDRDNVVFNKAVEWLHTHPSKRFIREVNRYLIATCIDTNDREGLRVMRQFAPEQVKAIEAVRGKVPAINLKPRRTLYQAVEEFRMNATYYNQMKLQDTVSENILPWRSPK